MEQTELSDYGISRTKEPGEPETIRLPRQSKKIYAENGSISLDYTSDRDTARTWKGLERSIEAAVDEALGEYRAMFRKEYDALCAKYNLPAEEKRHEFEAALEKFEMCNAEEYGPDEIFTREFFEYDVLEKIFGVIVEDEGNLLCPDCDGRGWWEHGLAGTRMDCEKCNGTGALTPKQLEAN